MVVAPGFIDINGQGDTGLFGDGRALNKLFQGVTTEIMGESNSLAPLNEKVVGAVNPADQEQVRRAREWGDFDTWLEELEDQGVGLNVASFLGGTTVRRYARGMRPGAPSPAELDTMVAVTRRSMRQGALGVATGLIYPPGSYAGTYELALVAAEAARHGGIYITHIRSESAGLLTALEEAIEIGRRSGAPVEVFHLKAAGIENWRLQDAAVARIEAAREAGVDVQASLYPYTAASTSLQACLPPWASENGRLGENLVDPETRARIAEEMARPGDGWENWCALSSPEGAVVVGVRKERNRPLIGRSLAEAAEERGVPWTEVVLDLLVDEGNASMVYFAMSEENVRRLLTLPWIKIGTDGGVWNPETSTAMTHPRAYGTYPRILGRYVREEGLLELEDAVRKMTWSVASRVGLLDRGLVREGMAADLVVFDPERIREVATFTDPHRLADGVVHLWVNGEQVIRLGRYTGALPGRFLRGPGASEVGVGASSPGDGAGDGAGDGSGDGSGD
jgi:dihydroorotase/N-acyl-D-amino-acid deacylase